MTPMPIVTITRKESFSSAHRLHRWKGKERKMKNWIRNLFIVAFTCQTRRTTKCLESATVWTVTGTTMCLKCLFEVPWIERLEWSWTSPSWKMSWRKAWWSLWITKILTRTLRTSKWFLRLPKTSPSSFGMPWVKDWTDQNCCTRWSFGKLIRTSSFTKEQKPASRFNTLVEYLKMFAQTCRRTQSEVHCEREISSTTFRCQSWWMKQIFFLLLIFFLLYSKVILDLCL